MSKDKYQEALDYIKGVVPLLKGRIIAYVEKIGLPNSIKILQELVDIYPEYVELKAKATPKKIVYREFMKLTPRHEYKESCPNCNSVFDCYELGKKHCPNCGQAIDWSE